ncbi:Velvet domain-containing protein [Mycena indigotica]|uniref:Velvet domain-containing protein n=1 Tax=Mycena indigotica TaxID=2126181 RepID=A0A8H6TEF5_9AGAR|nr:Velvet domain-containing protein [Mycena indigotica]KAF7315960.1 Velvet domain-containing protein [Mycena indigotica]
MAGISETLKYDITIRQQPLHARISAMKVSDRRPVDPPIIVQLNVTDPSGSPADISARSIDRPANRTPHLTNPYYFMYAALVTTNGDQDIKCENGKPSTSGALVSSVRVLKDHPNSDDDAAFFIFPDICVRLEGSWRFKLSLFVIESDVVKPCAVTFSQPFFVYPGKLYPGVQVSTPLTRALAAQGVKLRIRKEVRASDKTANNTSPSISLTNPELPNSPMNAMSSFSSPSRTYLRDNESSSSSPYHNNEIELSQSSPKRLRTLDGMSSTFSPSTEMRMGGMQLPRAFEGLGLGLGLGLPSASYSHQYRRLSHESPPNPAFGSRSHLPPPQQQWTPTTVRPPLPNQHLPQSFEFTVRSPFPPQGGNARGGQSDSDDEREGTGGALWSDHLLRPSHPSPETAGAGSAAPAHRQAGMTMYAPPPMMDLPISIFQTSTTGSPIDSSEEDLDLEIETESGAADAGYSWTSSRPVRETDSTPPSSQRLPPFWSSGHVTTFSASEPRTLWPISRATGSPNSGFAF